MLSTKLWTVGYKVMGALIILMVLGAIVLVSLNNAQLRAENQDMYADLQASRDNERALYEQLLFEGVIPEGDAPGESVPGPAGAAGERGPRGFPGADGEDGAPGADSTTPGPAGAPGKDGKNGADGAASTVPGPQGPEGPQGPQGEPGATGSPGPAGVSVVGITCMDDGTWRFVMSDTTQIDVLGPCRALPNPEGTP